jgi:hypothetical protein
MEGEKMISISQKLVISAAGWAALATLVNTHLASAGILVNNVSDDARITGAFVSDFDDSLFGESTQIADQFTLAKNAEISEVFWSGQYFPDGTLLVDNFTIRFFEIVQGTVSLEPLVELNLGSVERTDSGADFFTDVFNYSATIAPFSLKQGDYLFSIVNNTPGQVDDWAWLYTQPQEFADCGLPQNSDCVYFYRSQDGEAWDGYLAGDMAFAIAGEQISVPEPSMSISIVIALGLGALAKKSKK